MISKFEYILVLIFLLLTPTACKSGGSITGLQESCNLTDAYGSCEAKFRSLSGRYTKRFETNSTFPGEEAQSEITLSVEEGSVRVSIVKPDGTNISGVATPDKPITVTGTSMITAGATMYYIPIIFEALEENASGIEYVFSYQTP